MTSVPALSTHGVSWSLSAVTKGGDPEPSCCDSANHAPPCRPDAGRIFNNMGPELMGWVYSYSLSSVFFWCPTPAEKHQNLFSNI